MSDASAARPAAAPDLEAARLLWEAYAAAHPQAVAATGGERTVEGFGDSERLADELLAIVLDGRKRATAELVADFLERGDPVPRIGSHWIACDGRGVPRIVIRSVELRIGPFGTADAAFAAAEGEDDEIVFERFAVVWPPEHADSRDGRA